MKARDRVVVHTRDRFNGKRGHYVGMHLGELGVMFGKLPEDPDERLRADAWFRPAEVSHVASDRR